MTVEELIDLFLSGRPERTARAYANDIDEYTRYRGRSRTQAIAELLGDGPTEYRLALLRFVYELRRTKRAEATIDRRVRTVLAILRLAHDRRMIDWEPKLTDWSAAALAEVVEDRPGDAAYMLPRHPAEFDRLDLQHYALAEALGSLYLADVRVPRRVLDAGAGTGQWGADVIVQHPNARVVGFDLEPPRPGRPAGYFAVRGDLLQGLPFPSGVFDLVHQRLLFAGLPLDAWPRVVADLVRTCKRGGWVELAEGASWLESGGPASDRLGELTAQLWGTRGLDNQSLVFEELDGYLRDAGLRDVRRRVVQIPVGEWGGQLGSMWASDVRSLSLRMASVFSTRLGIATDEFLALMDVATREWEERHATYPIVVAWGRKPA